MAQIGIWKSHLRKMLECGRSKEYIKWKVSKWRMNEEERKKVLGYLENGKLEDFLGLNSKQNNTEVKVMSNNTSDIKEAVRQCLEEGKCDLLNEISKLKNDVDAKIGELTSSLDRKIDVMAKYFIRDKVKSMNKSQPEPIKSELDEAFNKVADQKGMSDQPSAKPSEVTKDDIKEAVRMCFEEGKCELLNEINKVKEELNSKIENIVKTKEEGEKEPEKKPLKALPIEEAMKDDRILKSILNAINQNKEIKDKLLSTLGVNTEEPKEEEPKNPIYKLVTRRR